MTDRICQCWRHPSGTVRRASCPVHGGPPLDRIFAAFRPADDNIALFFDRGMIDLTIAEARGLVATLNEALSISEGQHPAQTGADAANSGKGTQDHGI